MGYGLLVMAEPVGAISKTACAGGGHFDAPAASACSVNSRRPSPWIVET